MNLSKSYYENRIIFYNNLIKKFKNLNDMNECLVYHKKNNKIYYKIKNNIIFTKKISNNNNRYGIVYFTKLKKYKFASKMMKINYNHYDEIKISNYLSNLVINNKNPHFIITYKFLKCIYPPIIYDKNYPSIFLHKYFIIFTELAKGTLSEFIKIHNNNHDLMMNTFFQILISILSFHYHTSYIHDDCHYNNFLYFKIKPGGYIHYKIYGKDFYIKNLGYLWVIWDFGLMKKKSYNNIIKDYIRIIRVAFNYKYNYSNKLYNTFNNVYDMIYRKNNEKEIWEYLLDNIFINNKVNKDKIINFNNPYIIG